MYIIIKTFSTLQLHGQSLAYPGSINIRTLSKNLGAGNDKPRFVTSLLQELCKLGNHNWPVILFLKLS